MYIFFHSNKSTYDCFIATSINTRSTEFKMAESDSHNMSVSLLAEGSIDFFQESQEFLIDSYPLPVQNSIAEHPLNLKTSTPKLVLPKVRLMCEDFIEYSKIDENTIDSDATPDLDMTTFCKCDKNDPSFSAHIHTAENSDNSQSTHVDTHTCNVLDCHISHTSAYNKDTEDTNSGEYLTPTLEVFANSWVQIRGEEIIQQISYYKHKIRECEKKLIEDYNIAPAVVKRWIDLF